MPKVSEAERRMIVPIFKRLSNGFCKLGVKSWLRLGNVAQSSGCESRLGNC
jgi:hypothetical protein